MKTTRLVFKSRDYIGSAEPPATVLEDESRWGNNGSFLGAGEPNWVWRPTGLWVMRFDGSNDVVDLGSDPSLTFATATAYSFDMWLYTNDRANYQYFLGSAAGIPYLRLHDTNKLHFVAVGNVVKEVTFGAFNNQWVHIGFAMRADRTYDATRNGVNLGNTAVAPHSSAFDFRWLMQRVGETKARGDMVKIRIYNYQVPVEKFAAIFQDERHWFGV